MKSNLERQFHRTYKLPYETVAFPYVVTHKYTPDWQVSPTAFIETKGMWVGADRSKHKYIKQQHPHITILLVFQDPNRKLSKASKTTYGDWCTKNDIPFCSADDDRTIRRFIAHHSA